MQNYASKLVHSSIIIANALTHDVCNSKERFAEIVEIRLAILDIKESDNKTLSRKCEKIIKQLANSFSQQKRHLFRCLVKYFIDEESLIQPIRSKLQGLVRQYRPILQCKEPEV